MKMWVSMITAILIPLGGLCHAAQARIDIWPENHRYWQFDGKPVVLIGGSVEDNLFQIPNLEEHLDLLRSVGGNYVRNTMSCRDEGNVWPFKQLDNGRYDLDQWNPEFWNRFDRFLRLTSERGVVPQIELWATFDYYRDIWDRNPFNPKNNVNYTAEETGLPTKVDSHPTRTENNFFWSVPAERNQKTVLKYQQRFIDKMLSYSLNYGNVLYCMDNETSVTPEWGWYWSRFIRDRAKEKGVVVHTTEMWDDWNLAGAQHNATFDHPEVYSFVDVSQNNHQKGQAHWDNAQKQRRRIADHPRPLNNVKIYGADGGRFGDTQDGTARMWRNIIGGMASSRFHRPDSGVGLNETAQAHLRSMRMFLDRFDIFHAAPDSDNSQMGERQENEAYLTAVPMEQYAVYFPKGGDVELDLRNVSGVFDLQWLDIVKSQWREGDKVVGANFVDLKTPAEGHWLALLTIQRD